MGLTTLTKKRPILLTGKVGTGKSQKAKTFVNDPVIFYANSIDYDIGSIPVDSGIIIEDVHYKPEKDAILTILRNYRGQVVLTSINEKSVPKEIKTMCQIKRAGSKNHLRESIETLAPRSEEPFSYERDTFSLVMDYLKTKDRDMVKDLMLFNKPSDTQILTWLCENMHPNRLVFIDGVVRRRWSQQYFYEMLSYAHTGNMIGRVNMPRRGTYSKVPSLSRRLGVRNPKLLPQLLQDEEFKAWAKTKLNNAECRLLKLGEKKRRKKTDPIKVQQKSLEDFI
tara:strand:- start:695 stop:1537 length:843 start_codon:yes stop_codon:yes gene_type:complete